MQLLLALLFLMSFTAESNDSAFSLAQAALSAQKQWARLLHAKGRELPVIHGDFYIAGNSLTAEWDATLALLKRDQGERGFVAQSPACAYVARRKFFEGLGLLAKKNYDCPEYENWKNGLDPKGVALIFSSSYPNNPASHFGHTFLRVQKERFGNDLLDYAISFSATVDASDPGLLYALKGIMGGYEGRFDFAPYYEMVGIYNNNESRDLLEYELSFTPEELERLIDHTWELYSLASFPYYFFDENCSSVLARLLLAAKPDWEVQASSNWYYLPSDLVREVVAASEAANETITRKARPSLKKAAIMREERLNAKERSQLAQLNLKNIDEQNAAVLDAYLAAVQFKKFKSKNQLDEKQQTLFSRALRARAKLSAAKTKALQYRPSYPEMAHQPRAMTLGGESFGGSAVYKVGLKQGYHDHYNSDVGQAPYAQFDFLALSGAYFAAQKKWRLDEVTLFDVYSAHPYSSLDPQISWMVSGARKRAYEETSDLHYRQQLKGAIGLSWVIADHLFSLLAGAFASAGSADPKGGGLGPLVSAKMIFSPGEQLKVGLEAEWLAQLGAGYHSSRRLGVLAPIAWSLSRHFELRLISRYDRARGVGHLGEELNFTWRF